MDTILTEAETRVLASLVEKQLTTPEYYPLTLNSLTTACNQKNNRHPVTSYSEDQVTHALETLREKNLAYVFYGSNSRVPKYKHVLPEVLQVNAPETALMCALMLRGPQTPGELRSNASRLFEFTGLEQIEATLEALISRDPALVVRLARQPGQKEVRFAHLLNSEVAAETVTEEFAPRRVAAPQGDRVGKLEQDVSDLKAQMETLQEQFDEFRKQFE